MKLSTNLNDSLNEQILHEYRNQLIYTQLESIFEDFQLKNIAKYFHEQSLQEKNHGDKIVSYLNSRIGGKVNIGDVDFLKIDSYIFENLTSIGELYLSVEQNTTVSLEEIYDIAIENKSYIDLPFLSSMLQEQVEEEDTASMFNMDIKMTKDLCLFDKLFKN